jgi:Glycosyltransferase like family
MEDPEAYRRYAMRGIERVREADSEVFAFAAAGPLTRNYNLLLDAASRRDDVEALVLVQEDVEIDDPDFCAKVRSALAEPDVALVGSAGATGVTGIAWWEGQVSAAPAVQRYNEHGSGELPAFSWLQPSSPPMEVETLDGALLVLSPWTLANLRFDESLRLRYGFDLDYCLQVRATGRRIMTADLRTVRHRPLELVPKPHHQAWVDAHIAVAAKWEGTLPGPGPAGGSWKQRARYAEAEREAARTIAYSRSSDLEAQLQPLDLALEEITESAAWRLTKPLRELNLWRAKRRAARD